MAAILLPSRRKRANAGHGGDDDLVRLENLHIGHEVEPAHFGGEISLRADEFEMRAALGNEFRRCEARMRAIVVEQQNVLGGLCLARENIPA